MHKLEKHIEKHYSDLKSNSISVACSGGLDSIVLAYVLNKLNFNVNVIHVNYQLRGEDSELDAKFVEQFCLDAKIPFEKRTIDLNSELESGGNLQELARNVRYYWFKEIINLNSKNKVALAHHMNDQVETFFLNLGRKSGVMGLACMPFENSGIIRPLLDFSKEELKSYATENSIKWREDISNENSKYRRNLLRNVILPKLEQEIPSINESVIELIRQFQIKQRELEIQIQVPLTTIQEKSFIGIDQFQALSELEKIELFRQLGESAHIASAIEKLNHKGTFVELSGKRFNQVVFDGDQLSFVSKNEIQLPELILEKEDKLPNSFTKDEIYLDASKIKGEIKLRTWAIGDRIAPIGMHGTQLISDIISDAKLNAFEKAKVLVLCDDDTIHWCIGLKVSRVALAKQDSGSILKVKISE